MRANCSDSPPVEPLLDKLPEGPLGSDCASPAAPAQATTSDWDDPIRGAAFHVLTAVSHSLLAYDACVLRSEATCLSMPDSLPGCLAAPVCSTGAAVAGCCLSGVSRKGWWGAGRPGCRTAVACPGRRRPSSAGDWFSWSEAWLQRWQSHAAPPWSQAEAHTTRDASLFTKTGWRPACPNAKVRMYLVYLKYWTLNLMPLMV